MTQVPVHIDDGIALVRLNNPPLGHVDRGMVGALGAALDLIEGTAAVRAVVVTGETEGIFASHYSIEELEPLGRHLRAAAGGGTDDPLPVATELARHLARIEASPLPFVAAINGTCIGAGFELALACDIRIVEDGDFTLGLPEANLGLVPGAGGSQRLPRLIGPAKALELILMGRTISPIQAVQIGIAQELAADLALDAALVMARRLADQYGPASARIKHLVRQAREIPLAEGLAAERAAFLALLAEDEPIARMHDLNRGERDITD
ncbi:enoyl-CoA hydratase/isomerase family protein [Zavarzinia compransoris]|uniref:Enoyl-CoA hydratase n=1 Tax=Zavarzinia compransoris TaxID=1264899 RepID=A0A317E9Z0_9PROT|nr:enoyl-CoA hydratase/isomerase family protein [Zavarzinia compransoris]PWR23937.1 hypothetical protein DKG75_05145 [Zavarzinia compransoris]TDP48184.1 enoyl-CoA hydratase/carnithine racemase [Zavarzinia compransoris]